MLSRTSDAKLRTAACRQHIRRLFYVSYTSTSKSEVQMPLSPSSLANLCCQRCMQHWHQKFSPVSGLKIPSAS